MEIQVERKFTIEKQMVRDILICAFEGGSNYWYDQLEPLKRSSLAEHASDRFYDDLVGHGFKLVDKKTRVQHVLEPTFFRRAFQTMANNYSGHFEDLVKDNSDAETGDVFLQCLVFNEVKYG